MHQRRGRVLHFDKGRRIGVSRRNLFMAIETVKIGQQEGHAQLISTSPLSFLTVSYAMGTSTCIMLNDGGLPNVRLYKRCNDEESVNTAEHGRDLPATNRTSIAPKTHVCVAGFPRRRLSIVHYRGL